MSEFIYILENEFFPGVVEIGRTEREVAERVKELSSASGVPTGFTVFRKYVVEDAITAERKSCPPTSSIESASPRRR
jgi:hypothetical protein